MPPTVSLFGVPIPIGGAVSVMVTTRIGRLDHLGIVSDRYGADGQPMVLHASHLLGRVVEAPASDFVQMAVGPVRFVGYWGDLPPEEVLRRARAQIGKPYKLLSANCEHFATGVHGLEPTSPQLRNAAAGTVVLATAVGVLGVIAFV